ncbi:glycosyltransferase family 1 protein [Nocardia sp. 2]|uniref:Glycosyltransferase family 1 protein n=1 Tax=Nocardia acididurans TaxID=2802282 RepID=A0ABS1MCC9_9NOCA|nr:glycosyltransferase [Nocardia acididurans]MBL1078301.1 glycosyltransferase family 1 protein [Nocardia acididurans]
MSRLVIAVIGSRGDLAPLLGLGAGLRDAGHEVSVAAHDFFADLVTGCGFEFLPMPTNLDIDMTDPNVTDKRKVEWTIASPRGVRAMGQGLIDTLREVPADALLLGQLTEIAGFQLAESRDIPAIGLRFQPMSATAAHPPAMMGARSFGAAGNRFAAEAGTWLVDRIYADVVAGFRRDLGLPEVSSRELRRRRTESDWLVLHGYSPEILPRPADWRPGLEVTGYWWPPRPVGWEPSAELVEFLAAGPPPVFLGFGSIVDSSARSAEVSTMVGAALRRAGVRGIVQSGWLRLDVAGDDVLTVDEVPHDWLFPQVSAVVHHCGAGTVAAGLRAGVPAVGAPVYSDQPFWAQRLLDLGVSAATIPHGKLTVDRLAAAIHRAVTDTTLRDNAIRLAARLAAEDGVGHAVKAIEARLAGGQP